MVDAVRQAKGLHVVVVNLRPAFAELLHQIPFLIAPVFRAGEPFRCNGPVGEQHVGVEIAFIPAMVHGRRMDGDVRNHPVPIDAMGGGEAAEHGDVLIKVHLVG